MVGSTPKHVESSIPESINRTKCTSLIESKQMLQEDTKEGTNSEVFYGTYDEETNCITIVIKDENDVCIEDARIEEVSTTYPEESNTIGEYISTFMDTDSQSLTGISLEEPPMELLSPMSSLQAGVSPHSSRGSLSPQFFEPRSNKFDLFSSSSDGGYESIDSPLSDMSSSNYQIQDGFNDMWNESFQELFPSLLE